MAKRGPIKITHLPHRIEPDPARVIPRFFGVNEAATRRVIRHVISLGDDRVAAIIRDLEHDFSKQHEDIRDIWLEHYARIEAFTPSGARIDTNRRLLIGAYFTMDYAIEAAALFNPSIVPAPDQGDISEGSTRFVMSLRATGEGHLSSIVFRRGMIDAENRIIIETSSPVSRRLTIEEHADYDTERFRKTLADIGASNEFTKHVIDALGSTFTLKELGEMIDRAQQEMGAPHGWEQSSRNMYHLARSSYKLTIPEDAAASELVIFPSSERESHGIEDLRLVRFTDDDGSVCYYGTFTAFNGSVTFPTLLETRDFKSIEIETMYGRLAKNKGMALFPRKIGGKYVMSGRLDGENLFILESDDVRVWNHGRKTERPQYWWEAMIMGNCGSPMETDDGWLLLTHGVGPMRQYCIGAALLDLDDPATVKGRLEEPLIVPVGRERVGYVPNVVYTCGAMIHGERLIIPYAMSDMVTSFASVDLGELLDALKRG
jgi:predicted GH43/DUF377 family glycosyl hydrolase